MAATALNSFKSSRVGAAAVAGVASKADAANGNTYTNTGREILVITTDAGGTREVEITDVNGNVAYKKAIAASKVVVIGPLPVDKFGQTVSVKASNEAVTIAVVQLHGLAGFQVGTGG